jgi:hypothetical protein
MNILKGEFDSIKWYSEFIVEFKNGKEQIFTSTKGVQLKFGGKIYRSMQVFMSFLFVYNFILK